MDANGAMTTAIENMQQKHDRCHSANRARALVLILAVFAALLCARSPILGQTNACGGYNFLDPRILWRGSYNFTVTANPSDSDCACNVNNSASGTFRYVYNGFPIVSPDAVASANWSELCSCAPESGQEGEVIVGSGQPAGNLGPGIQIYSDCTYTIDLPLFVMGTWSDVYCDGPVPYPNTKLYVTGPVGEFGRVPALTHRPLPPLGQPLAGTIIYVSPDSYYCDIFPGSEKYTFTWNIVPLVLKITSVQTPFKANNLNTFISTDSITLKATLTPPEADAKVKWTVRGLTGGVISEGLPSQEIHSTDSQGVSTFTYTPGTGAFRILREYLWTGGSLKANPPIAFEVTAELERDGVTLRSRLTEEVSALGKLEQDELDILRQEYVDYKMSGPARGQCQAVASFANTGNYAHGWNLEQLESQYEAILDKYRRTTIILNGNNVALPLSAQVLVTLGYINPQKDKAIGRCNNDNIIPDAHLRGRALDLVPGPLQVEIGQRRTWLDRYHDSFPHLVEAGKALSALTLLRTGCNTVTPGNLAGNHVHVEF
jgi:hypothetical protein